MWSQATLFGANEITETGRPVVVGRFAPGTLYRNHVLNEPVKTLFSFPRIEIIFREVKATCFQSFCKLIIIHTVQKLATVKG